MSGSAHPPLPGGFPRRADGVAAGDGARHRARSPIVSPGPLPALLTAALAALLAGTAATGRPGAALPAVVVLQAVTAAGWFRLNGMWPARQGIALAFAGGLAADAAVLAAPRAQAAEVVIGALGVWFLLVIMLQLRHRGSSRERLDSLAATSGASLLTLLATGHLAAVEESASAVAVTAAGAGVAVLAASAPGLGLLTPVVALSAAAGAGAAATWAGGLGAAGLLLGAAGGVCALIGLRVASYDFPSRFVHLTAGVALPLTAAAPAAWLLAGTVA